MSTPERPLKRPTTTQSNQNPKRQKRFVPVRAKKAKPLVIFCHGVRLNALEPEYTQQQIPVGFFVSVGLGISQWAAYDIFHNAQSPADWPEYLPNLALTPLTDAERRVANRLISSTTYPHPIVYLDNEVRLVDLVNENVGEFTEIWLLCCTMTAPGTTNQIDTGILDIKMDVPHAYAMVGEKQAWDALQNLIGLRRKSMAAAADFLRKLGDTYIRYVTLREPGPAIVTEWQISLLPQVIAADPNTWVPVIDLAYESETLPTLVIPPGDLTDLGAAFRKSTAVMFGVLDDWPNCVGIVRWIYGNQAGATKHLWQFCAPHPNVALFGQTLAGLSDSAAAINPGDLSTWESYLTCHTTAVAAQPQATALIVDHAVVVGDMVANASKWDEFTGIWQAISGPAGEFPSVVTLLRAESAKDAILAQRIRTAES